MQSDKRLPHLRICVNSECNFSCFYCKPGGESSSSSPFTMNIDDIQRVLEVVRNRGFDRIKFTGGEPFLRPDILEVFSRTFDLGFPDVEVITNGAHLLNFLNDEIFNKLSLLTVSLDSLDYHTFNLITKRTCLSRVLEGLRRISENGPPIRLNMVLCKLNCDELIDMIDFAGAIHAELKIHELLQFRVPDQELWEKYFISPTKIRPVLEQLSFKEKTVFIKEKYGSPMTKYYIRNGPNVVLFDSNQGVRYGDICSSCSLFTCQDGLYALKLTHDGKLKRCWGRDDINLDILTPLRNNDLSKVYALLDEAIDTFANSWLSLERIPTSLHERVSLMPL